MADDKTVRIMDSPDGGYGWVIVLASIVIHISTGAIYNAIGVLLVALNEYFDQGTEQVAWIASLCGVMMCISGFGLGIAQVSAIVLIGKYFKRRHAFANGAAYSGTAIGMLCFPPISHFLLEYYGWRGTMFIVAGLSAQIFVCGALMTPPRTMAKIQSQNSTASLPEPPLHRCTENYEDEIDLHISTPVNRNMKGTAETEFLNGISITRHNICSEDIHDEDHFIKERTGREGKGESKVKSNVVFSKLGIHLFAENRTFSLICIAQFFEGCGSSTVTALLFARTVHVGISKLNAAFMLSILGICSLVCRVSHGLIIDLKIISATRLLGIAIGTYGVGVLLNTTTSTYVVLMLLAAVLGVADGTLQPLVPICMRECVGIEEMDLAFGWDYFAMGLGYLVGPPFGGWLCDTTGNYDVAFYITGTVLIGSGILVVLAPLAGSKKRRQNRNWDILSKSDIVEKS
ncbi:monocarboxylate transporter 12-like [Glandiceps talaboti]